MNSGLLSPKFHGTRGNLLQVLRCLLSRGGLAAAAARVGAGAAPASALLVGDMRGRTDLSERRLAARKWPSIRRAARRSSYTPPT